MNAHTKYGYGLYNTDLEIEPPEMALDANSALIAVSTALRQHLPITPAHAMTHAATAVAQAQRPDRRSKFVWEGGELNITKKPAVTASKPAASRFNGKKLIWRGGISNPHREGTRSYTAMQPIIAAGRDGLTYEEWLKAADPQLNTLYGAVRDGAVEIR